IMKKYTVKKYIIASGLSRIVIVIALLRIYNSFVNIFFGLTYKGMVALYIPCSRLAEGATNRKKCNEIVSSSPNQDQQNCIPYFDMASYYATCSKQGRTEREFP